jgi:RHS repeat-associated protein
MSNRIARTEAGVTTRFVLDLSGDMSRVLAETDESGNVTAYYVYGIGLISRIMTSDTRNFYHYNNRGDAIALTNDTGIITDKYAYDEYGKLMASDGGTANPFKYVGRHGVMDEGNNLYFMRARYYDATVGRFLNEDPLGFEGGDWNLFAYVGGNPVVGIDPSGLEESISAKQQGPYNTYLTTAYNAYIEKRAKSIQRENTLANFAIKQLAKIALSAFAGVSLGLAPTVLSIADFTLRDRVVDSAEIDLAVSELQKLNDTVNGTALLREYGRCIEEGGGCINQYGLYVTADDIFSKIMDYVFFKK